MKSSNIKAKIQEVQTRPYRFLKQIMNGNNEQVLAERILEKLNQIQLPLSYRYIVDVRISLRELADTPLFYQMQAQMSEQGGGERLLLITIFENGEVDYRNQDVSTAILSTIIEAADLRRNGKIQNFLSE
jgi:hypothetical protein